MILVNVHQLFIIINNLSIPSINRILFNQKTSPRAKKKKIVKSTSPWGPKIVLIFTYILTNMQYVSVEHWELYLNF